MNRKRKRMIPRLPGMVFRLSVLLTCTCACGQYRQVDQDELIFKMSQETRPLLFDVRTRGEYEQGHIPGSINISHNEVPKRLSELSPHAESEIVIYCRTGRRAQGVMSYLEKSGFTNLAHLE